MKTIWENWIGIHCAKHVKRRRGLPHEIHRAEQLEDRRVLSSLAEYRIDGGDVSQWIGHTLDDTATIAALLTSAETTRRNALVEGAAAVGVPNVRTPTQFDPIARHSGVLNSSVLATGDTTEVPVATLSATLSETSSASAFDRYLSYQISGEPRHAPADLFWLANALPADALPSFDRIDSSLLRLYGRERQGFSASLAEQTIHNTPFAAAFNSDGVRPVVMIHVDDVAAAVPRLEASGVQVVSTYDKHGYHVVNALMPIESIDALVAMDDVRHVVATPRPAVDAVGSATNQGEATMLADQMRRLFNVDGTGIDIGVISDTVSRVGNGIDDSTASGDIPFGATVDVLDDNPLASPFFGFTINPGTDEGRGMIELIADVGSGFDYAFHTGSFTPFDMAGAFDELRSAGADVIVDDISWDIEPIFQDGAINQAVSEVSQDHGVLVFGSAGNQNGGGFNASWSDSDNDGRHNFSGTDETFDFQLGAGDSITITLHWSQPHGLGTLTDLDIELLNSFGTRVLADSNNLNIGLLSWDWLSFTNDTTSTQTYKLQFVETLFTDATGLELYMIMRDGNGTFSPIDNYTNGEPSISGNHTSPEMFTIAAHPYTTVAALEGFSSLGPVRVFFNPDGSTKSSIETRQKPDFAAPDGVDTSFFGSPDADGTGFPNFFGTSAAAPNAAAVAGLLLDQAGGADSISRSELASLLALTARGPFAGTWNNGWGRGAVNAVPASMVSAGPRSPESSIALNQFGDAIKSFTMFGDDDIDGFRFAVESSATTSMNVLLTTANTDPAVVLWDDDADDVETINFGTGLSANTTRSLDGRKKYLLEIYDESQTTSGTTTINGILSINGPSPAVTTLTSNLFGSASTTASLAANEADYYRVVVPANASGGGFITASPSIALNTTIHVFDSVGDEVLSSDAAGTGALETVTFGGFAPGEEYTIRVGSREYATSGLYNFAVKFDVVLPPNNTIRGRKFNDANGNGEQDAGEAGLSDWVIYLDQNQNGQLDANETFVRTNPAGDYEFTGIASGTYFVSEQQQPGWTQTLPFNNPSFESATFVGWDTIGNARVVRGDVGVDPTRGQFQAMLSTGAGAVSQAALETFSDYVAGSLDGTPAGNAIEGSALRTIVTVQPGTEIGWDWNFLTNQATPSSNNDFVFVSILSTPGLGSPNAVLGDTNSTFILSASNFVEETGYQTFSTTINFNATLAITLGVVDEGSSTIDSALLVDNLRVVPATGVLPPGTHRVVLNGTNQIVSGRNFGNRPTLPAEIHGTKFFDRDADGVQDAEDYGLVDWTVYADLNANGRFDDDEPFDITDGDGAYAIVGAPVGTYAVGEFAPAGWTQTAPRHFDDVSSVMITEIDLDTPDFIEIANLSRSAAKTVDWRVFVSSSSSNINAVTPVSWTLPDQINVGEVLYRTDSGGDNYWGTNIGWGNGNPGWAMILDSAGKIVDWVGWGWSAAEIALFNVNAGPFQNVRLGNNWSGATVVANARRDTIQRIGDDDTNTAADFTWSVSDSKGALNVGLTAALHGVEVLPEQIVTDLDFGSALLGSVSGTKFNDTNGNGLRDGGETGLEGWLIYVDENRDGQFAHAGRVDADRFPVGTVLGDIVPGVILTAVGTSPGGTDVTGTNDAFSSSGGRVFRNSASTTWVENGRELRGDFPIGVAMVAIDFVSDDSSDIGKLEVYDAGDNLLDTYVTADLSTGVVETMRIDRPAGDIAYFLAFGQGGQSGRLDNLVFNVRERHIEPDEYATGTPLDDAVDAVTLSVEGGLTDNTVSVGTGTATTGTRVFRNVASTAWSRTLAALRADFDRSVTQVSIDAAGPILTTSVALEAFDRQGNLLTVDTQTVSSGQQRTLTVARAEGDIAYVRAFGVQFGVNLDNLRFTELGSTERYDVTAADGTYTIDHVPLGTHDVRELSQVGWMPTSPSTDGHTVALKLTAPNATGRSFGNVQPVRIEGNVWYDQDPDGIRDPSEPPLAGWLVYLDGNGNNTFDHGETSTLSAANGSYAFVDLVPGTYGVGQFVRPQWTQTSLGSPVVDQSQLDGSGIINAFHGTNNWAQSFILGKSGKLDAIELSLSETGSGGDLIVEVLDLGGGDPASAPVLGSVAVSEMAIGSQPVTLNANAITATFVDLSSLNLNVDSGDILGVRLSTSRTLPNFYAVRRATTDQYPGGTNYINNNPSNGDLAFKLFVSSAGPTHLTLAPGETTSSVDFGNHADNLVRNGNAEEPLVGLEIPSWTEVVGTNWRYRNTNPEPQDGESYFTAIGGLPAGSTAELAQDVDVSAFASTIDAGTQAFLFQGHARSLLTIPSDRTRFVVEYRDAGGAMLDSFDTGLFASVSSWRLIADERVVPPQTRTARVRMLSDLGLGTSADGYFDNIVLVPSDVRGPIGNIQASATSILAGEQVDFDAGFSVHGRPFGAIAGYDWDYDYDGVVFDVDATGPTASHVFNTAGTRTVALRVRDFANPPATHVAMTTIDVASYVVGRHVLYNRSSFTRQGQVASQPFRWDVRQGGNGHYYEVVKAATGITWSTAAAAAKDAGGHLATITTQAENDFVYNLIGDTSFWRYDSLQNFGPWIGGVQPAGSDEPNGRWQWVTGEPFEYTNWFGGRPDEATAGEDRVHFYAGASLLATTGPQWNDKNGSAETQLPVAYVVEYEGIDAAIAPDKSPLLPGELATTSNYTSYSRGLNGVMVDLVGIGDVASLSVADFAFTVGNVDDDASWVAAPPPSQVWFVAIAPHVHRVAFTWSDNSIENEWLAVHVLANVNTGLSRDERFYYGNAIGDTGNLPDDFRVDFADRVLIAANFSATAAIDDPYDINRDGRVDGSDAAIAAGAENGLTGDFDRDDLVGVADVSQLQGRIGALGESDPYLGDLSGDGIVSRVDAAQLSSHFGSAASAAMLDARLRRITPVASTLTPSAEALVAAALRQLDGELDRPYRLMAAHDAMLAMSRSAANRRAPVATSFSLAALAVDRIHARHAMRRSAAGQDPETVLCNK